MPVQDLMTCYLRFKWIQNNMDLELSKKIFGIELYEHFYNKWTKCDTNIIYFISMLDLQNKEKLFNFINCNI